MPRGRPKVALVLSDSERDQLLAMTRSRSMPHALVRRAQIVMMSVDGANNIAIADALNVSRLTVGTWARISIAVDFGASPSAAVRIDGVLAGESTLPDSFSAAPLDIMAGSFYSVGASNMTLLIDNVTFDFSL